LGFLSEKPEGDSGKKKKRGPIESNAGWEGGSKTRHVRALPQRRRLRKAGATATQVPEFG